ncbi:MAG TPA: serine/threonine-protein kinase [Acidimicrobiales bacterium]|nr:serine/threonine-protein kinase [Acidimicrobiales bacterium]
MTKRIVPRSAGTRVDHYELVEHLAHGAQTEVHRAKDLRTGEEVVIKFPHGSVLDHPVLVARWRRETHLTESLAHPNVQCRLDVGEYHREPYVVLEYAGGGSVDAWVGVREALPVEQVVQWGRQLAQALAYLHHLGIVHRDLKPGNLLVTDDLQLKLADFGAASVMPTKRRWWNLPAPPEGTAEYLSPEQIIGRHGDERSDIYGWGVVMYELLTGHVPHTGADQFAAMAAHLSNVAAPLHDLRSDVPPTLEAVVLTAMRRRPEARYPNVQALLADLDNLEHLNVADFDLSAEPPTAGVIGGSEGPALLRLVLFIAATFMSVVALVLLLSVALR